MTTLLAWISYTTTGERPELPRALYIASDSRLTWDRYSAQWDAGRKLFAPVAAPHLFGYSGDVIFPSLILSQITSAIDQGILFSVDADPEDKHEAILESIKLSHSVRRNFPDDDFTIIHACRTHGWPNTSFACWEIAYFKHEKRWRNTRLSLPKKTRTIRVVGTGASAARDKISQWDDSYVKGTNRAIFSAFAEAIASNSDPKSGGVPQLSALYTEGHPRVLGYIKNGEAYLHGLRFNSGDLLNNIEWRDELFQRINPSTGKITKGARRFARPSIV